MRSTAAADWRGSLPFDRAVRLSDVTPGDPARCVACGTDAAARPRDELWAFKHRHPQHHDGYVRIYCDAHVPRPAVAPAARTAGRAAAPRSAPRAAPRRTTPERTAAVCPDCFVEVPATGVCGVCGQTVAA